MELTHESKLGGIDNVADKHAASAMSHWHKELAEIKLSPVAKNSGSSEADDRKCGLHPMELCDSQATAKLEDKAKTENLEQNDRPVDAATKKNIVSGVAKEIADTYTFPELAKNIQSQLSKDLAEGKFDSETTSVGFAKALTTELQTIGNDKHLAVNFNPENIGHSDSDAPTANELKESLEFQKQIHSGITATKSGDVGSLKIDTFMPINDSKNPDGAALTRKDIDDAMHSVAGVKTLMIDLQDNDGGLAETCLQVQNYLQPPGTHVNSIIWRNQNQDNQ